MAKWESGKRMTIEKKSNGKLMLCNSAPPILGGIHDHFLCKWQQGFQKLPLPNEHTWCEKIGHNAWSHWVSWFQETVEKLSKRNWQHFIYGEIKNIKMKIKVKGHWVWKSQEAGLVKDGRTEEVTKDNVGWRHLIPCGHPWKQQLKLEGGVLRFLYVFCDCRAVWAGSWQLAGKDRW